MTRGKLLERFLGNKQLIRFSLVKDSLSNGANDPCVDFAFADLSLTNFASTEDEIACTSILLYPDSRVADETDVEMGYIEIELAGLHFIKRVVDSLQSFDVGSKSVNIGSKDSLDDYLFEPRV